jgi:hypothetical protein
MKLGTTLTMARLLYSAIFSLLCICPFNKAQSQLGEEFSGELSSWANVKSRFGAAGDGKNDDTKALQKALDSLSVQVKNFNMSRTGYATIYLPAGNYRITATLILQGKIGVNVIGEDPAKTMIIWDGQAGQPMFWANGSAYFKISRIAWNANLKKSITGIEIKWKTKWDNQSSQSFAPLNIEISDCHFIGRPGYGITGGTYAGTDATGANDSEVTIQRCYFKDCSEAGIQITGFNALDYWIWDCRFIQCKIGVGNAHGNYHAYRCYFEGSTQSDFINDNGYYTSVRACYSLNSESFSNDLGASCNPFKRIFQGNQIKPKRGNSIYFAHVGKPVFLDNIFIKGRDKPGEYTLHYSSWCGGIYEVLSIGNKYAMANPLRMAVPNKRVFSVNDNYKYTGELPVSKDAFLAGQNPLPGKFIRRVFEVPRNATSEKIQELINKAAQLKDSRPIIHFGFGTYILDKTLTVPAGSDIQFIGDGLIYASVIKKGLNFPGGKSMLKIKGPTNIVVRDLQILDHEGSGSDINAIEFINVDQPGSTAFIDQLHTSSATSIEMDGLNYLYVQKQNSFFSTGNRIYGGELTKKGQGTAGLHCFGGQFADLNVQGNARFVSKDCWWEGANKKPLDITGSGTITLDGIMIAPITADSSNVIEVKKFSGKISIMNAYIQGGVAITPDNPSLSLLLWNIHFYHAMNPTRFVTRQSNFRGAFLGLSTQCFEAGNANCGQIMSKEDQLLKVADEQDFLLQMLAQNRASMPRQYRSKAGKASSILLSRVSIGNSNTAVKFLQ